MSKLNKNICLKVLVNLYLIFAFFITGSFGPPKSKPYGLTKVVIDAGHGGHDSGCLGKKVKEKDVALGISLRLGKYIEDNYPDVTVIYTRKKDEFVELYERAEIANNAKADLFICIHCNSACTFDKKRKKEICNKEIAGVESWVMGLNKSEANLEVSKRENEVILLEKDYTSQYDGFDPNSPEANIIFSLYQNTYLEQSLRMATFVQQEVKSKGRGGRGVKQAGFLVLYKTFMPSILIETGFLSNENEEKYLASAKGQDEIAHSIFKAFEKYKGSMDNPHEQEKPVQKKEETPQKQQPKSAAPADESTAEMKVPSDPKDPELVALKSQQEMESGKKSTDPPKKEEESPKKQEDSAKKVTEPVTKPADPVKKVEAAPKKSSETVKENSGVMETTVPRSSADDVLQWSVQFYTAAKAVPDNHKIYKSFDDVREDYESGIYKYSTGIFTTREEAVQLQNKIRLQGYKDAFVVAFFNNKKISVKEAMEMSSKKIN